MSSTINLIFERKSKGLLDEMMALQPAGAVGFTGCCPCRGTCGSATMSPAELGKVDKVLKKHKTLGLPPLRSK